jgi:hypothetical protein
VIDPIETFTVLWNWYNGTMASVFTLKIWLTGYLIVLIVTGFLVGMFDGLSTEDGRAVTVTVAVVGLVWQILVALLGVLLPIALLFLVFFYLPKVLGSGTSIAIGKSLEKAEQVKVQLEAAARNKDDVLPRAAAPQSSGNKDTLPRITE